MHRRIEIRENERREWTVAGLLNPERDGCIDPDLAATPATKTLAIKRLAPPFGGGAKIRTARFMFPDPERLGVPQRYTRTAERPYFYEGLHNGFAAEFDVVDAGFVTDCPDSWERLPPSPTWQRRDSDPRAR